MEPRTDIDSISIICEDSDENQDLQLSSAIMPYNGTPHRARFHRSSTRTTEYPLVLGRAGPRRLPRSPLRCLFRNLRPSSHLLPPPSRR
eukprot:41120-Prymnesium_polylepis.1